MTVAYRQHCIMVNMYHLAGLVSLPVLSSRNRCFWRNATKLMHHLRGSAGSPNNTSHAVLAERLLDLAKVAWTIMLMISNAAFGMTVTYKGRCCRV